MGEGKKCDKGFYVRFGFAIQNRFKSISKLTIAFTLFVEIPGTLKQLITDEG